MLPVVLKGRSNANYSYDNSQSRPVVGQADQSLPLHGLTQHTRHKLPVALHPLTNTFFQLGILYSYLQFVEFVVHSVGEGMGRCSHSLLTHLHKEMQWIWGKH